MKFIQDQRPLILRPAPSMLRNAACASVIFFYLLAKYALTPYLPKKWFVDSEKIYKILGGDTSMQGGSFDATAQIYAIFPAWSHDLIVTIVGITCIIIAFKATRTMRGIIVASLMIAPLLLLGLLVPSKETIVFVMTIIALSVYRFFPSQMPFIATIVLLYVLFGLNVRIYFLLILGIWIALIMLPRIPIIIKPLISCALHACFQKHF